MMSKRELIKKLYDCVKSDDFLEKSYLIVEDLEKYKDLSDTIEPIIKLIELNPDVYFGNPGPLVHFLEACDDEIYESKLIESLKRSATEQTLFMFNRVLNSKDDVLKKGYISILESLIYSNKMDEHLKNIAKEYLNYQKKLDMQINYIEEVNIVLTKKLDSKLDLIKIKKIFGLDESIKELLDKSKKLPMTIEKSVPIGRARNKIKELGSLSNKVELLNCSNELEN